MDVYTTSFTVPRRPRQTAHTLLKQPSVEFTSPITPVDPFTAPRAKPPKPDPHTAPSAADAEAVQSLAMVAMTLHGCHVSYAVADGGKGWNFLVSGAYNQVMAARGMLLKDCPVQSRATIKVPRSEILDSPTTKPTIKPEVRQRLDEIAGVTGAHIAVVNSPFQLSTRTPPDGISNSAGWSGLETERACELVITGQGDAIELARVRLLVMLDEFSGLHAEPVEIDRKLHSIMAGRKRNMLQTVQEETGTNIYYPNALQGIVGPDVAAPSQPGMALRPSPNTIWITGEFFGVQRARDMLFQVATTKGKAVISRDAAILPRKLDWMVTDRADELRTVMSDNATFIQFPPIGSSTSLITVFGDHRVNISRTIRSVMQLTCQYYVASFWLLPMQFNPVMAPPTLNPAQVAGLLPSISSASGAEIVFKNMCFEMHGLEHEVRAAINMIMELDVVKSFHHEIRIQIELANEHREFISGKKNGKINKIMQTTNVKIKFETFNDHNFLIDIAGNDTSVVAGLGMLQEELPAEVSFHVPESYHKRIIGVGGRSIQRIMKKYGVYVKFSNAEEFAALGGYNDNEDNVIARTPAKNTTNLENLKQSVMELVNPKDKDFIIETVSIPRRYHRILLGEKSIFIHDIENKTNSRVRFPDKETASDVVTIFGPESQVQIASAMLLDHVPFEADMAVPPHADLPRLCTSPEFAQFVEQIKRDFQLVISPNVKGLSNVGRPGNDGLGECSFKFRCQRSNTDSLMTARELLEQFLLDHNVHVYPSATSHTHKRGDSFTQAFPHFDSKLLAAATRTRESTDLSRPSESLVDRRLRLAASSPDVKALFNGAGAYVYNLEHHDEMDSPASSIYAPNQDQEQEHEDYWTPLPPIGTGYHRQRHSHSEDALKRGSDSLLDSKIKEQLNHKPRSVGHRAQSLDLTMSLSRITESSNQRPHSPTESNGDGDNGSPTSVTAPSFPSVYGQPMSQRSSLSAGQQQSIRRSGRVLDEEAVDEVSRVISNLGL